MLNIYYGRESVDHEKFIIDHIDLKGRALIIVPDQYTLEAERRLFSETGAEALMDVEVISMSRLGYRLLSELGGSKRTFIDKYGRHMILSQVAKDHSSELTVFRGLETKSSFLEMVNNFISEMKQYNSGLSELEAIRDKVDSDTYVYRKLCDMALIYGEYEKKIRGRYTDSEDYIDLFLSKIGSSKLICGNTIWIYGFDSFAPKAISVIGELMTYAGEVNIVLTSSSDPKDRDAELFDLSRLVIRKLMEAADIRHVEHREALIPDTYETYKDHEKYAAIRHLERELYALPSRPYPGDVNTPVLVEASNIYNEAENAAAYVLHLLRDEGFRMNDIKVIVNDQDVRGPILRRIFEEYGLDLFSDSGRSVEDNPIIRYIMSLFDVVIERFDTQAVISMLKTGLASLDPEEIADLENYAIKYRIKGSMWKKDFIRGSFEYEKEAMARLNELRRRAVEPCMRFEEIFKAAATYGDFIKGLYAFLRDDIDLVSRIEDLEKVQIEEGREDLAEETDQVWDSFLRITEQINEIMGSESFDRRSMRELLTVGLSGLKVGMLPPSKDGLLMGTMQRTRTGQVRALVVVGANEGVLPKGRPSQGIFGDDEKTLFRDEGIELLKVDSIALMEEKMGIYRNLSGYGERLYVSYSMSDAEGSAAKASPIFYKLKEIFPNVKVKTDAISSGDVRFLMNGEMSGLRHMANSLEKATEGEDVPDDIRKGLNWYRAHDPEKLDTIRQSLSFTNKAEDLDMETAAMLYKRDPSGDLSASPSRIERFSRCPFSHFVSYGLRPEERRTFEVANREIGDVLHACMMKLTDKLSVNGLPLTDPTSPWMTVTDDEIKELIKSFLEEEMETYRGGVFSQGNEEKYRSERLLETFTRVASNLVEQVRAGSIIRGRYEVRFGRGREIPPIVMQLGEEAGNAKVYIEGIIDRVDYLPGSRVKIIDYKTSLNTISLKEAEQGFKLQLMLYLQAAMEDELKPAGVFYFMITEPFINMTGNVSEGQEGGQATPDPDKLAKAISKEFRMNGFMSKDPETIRNMAGDFEKFSDILPLQNSSKGIVYTGRSEDLLLSDEDFERLKETVSDTVAKRLSELIRGKVDIHPMMINNVSACKNCDYKGLCRFDSIFEGNSWNALD